MAATTPSEPKLPTDGTVVTPGTLPPFPGEKGSMAKPILATLFLTLVFTVLGGLIRPQAPDNTDLNEAFWVQKYTWGPDFDMVAAGDSRTYRSIAPSEMVKDLPGWRIGNFGFSSAGFDKTYLDAIGKKIDPKSAHKAIILGITPHSLTAKSLHVNGFLDVSKRNLVDQWINLHMDKESQFFRSYSPRELEALGKFKRKLGYPLGVKVESVYHDDGWVSAETTEVDTKMAQSLRKNFEGNPVLPQAVQDVMNHVRQWRAEGIKVYAFRPPSSPVMLDNESLANFDQNDFVKKFTDAGGVWLDFPEGKYPSHDGVHIRGDGARVFSRDLAKQILEHETTGASH